LQRNHVLLRIVGADTINATSERKS